MPPQAHNHLTITGQGTDLADYVVTLNGVEIFCDELKLHMNADKTNVAKLTMTIDHIRLGADTLTALAAMAAQPD